MTTPLYNKDDQYTRPLTDTEFFLVAQNGVFLCRNNKFFQSDVRIWCDKISFTSFHKPWSEWERKEQEKKRQEMEATAHRIDCLHPHEDGFKCLFPQIKKAQVLQKIVGFFDWVYKKHHSESIVLLYWDVKRKRYHYYCPPQHVSSASCNYPPMPTFSGRGVDKVDNEYGRIHLPPMCMLVGTIHSHCDFDTGFSTTDERDEKFTDGVHVIVGRLRDKMPGFACTLLVDGKRFVVPEETWMQGFAERDEDFPKSWMKQIEKQSWSSGWWGSSSTSTNKSKIGFSTSSTVTSYPEKCPLCNCCLTMVEYEACFCPICKKSFGDKGITVQGTPPVDTPAKTDEQDDQALLYEAD